MLVSTLFTILCVIFIVICLLIQYLNTSPLKNDFLFEDPEDDVIKFIITILFIFDIVYLVIYSIYFLYNNWNETL